MDLDFRADLKTISAYIERRVADYDPSSNAGPGDPGEPIQQITLGYQFDQAGWVALVFDTRPDAEPDGEWQGYIQENMLELNHWCEAFDMVAENETPILITLPDDSPREIEPGIDMEDFAEYFGWMLRDALLEARSSGLLARLPLAEKCVMGVEEHEGYYGWPHYENRDEGLVS